MLDTLARSVFELTYTAPDPPAADRGRGTPMTRTASKSAPSARRNVLTSALCGCGCGVPVRTANSVYAPGHDARHAGFIAREIASTGAWDALVLLPSPALKAKAKAMAERLTAKPAPKAKAVATATAPVKPVKVGRWTYPAMIKDGALLRNTKRDGSGEWIAA